MPRVELNFLATKKKKGAHALGTQTTTDDRGETDDDSAKTFSTATAAPASPAARPAPAPPPCRLRRVRAASCGGNNRTILAQPTRALTVQAATSVSTIAPATTASCLQAPAPRPNDLHSKRYFIDHSLIFFRPPPKKIASLRRPL